MENAPVEFFYLTDAAIECAHREGTAFLFSHGNIRNYQKRMHMSCGYFTRATERDSVNDRQTAF